MALKYKNTNLEVNGNLKVTSNLTDGTNSISVAEIVNKQDALTAGSGISLENDTVSVDTSVIATQEQVTSLSGDIDVIEEKIPSQASAQNQLADKDFVNSSIATNTAYFLGTYNVVTDLGLTIDATHTQVAEALSLIFSESGAPIPSNNDYVFVSYPDATISTQFTKFERYKYNSEEISWAFEYELNNSSFTAEQWAAINSGITSSMIDDFMTLDTDQTISGVKTFGNDVHIAFYKKLYLDSNNPNLFGTLTFTDAIESNNTIKPSVNNLRDLGTSSFTWKDLYLSGRAYIPDIVTSAHDFVFYREDGTTQTFNIGNASGQASIRYTFVPMNDNSVSLGTSNRRWLNGYFSGQVYAENTLNVINASDIVSNTLTQEQYDLITNGKPTLIKGTLSGENVDNTFLLNQREDANYCYYYFMAAKGSATQFGTFRITKSTKAIYIAYTIAIGNAGTFTTFNGKSIPSYPSNTGTFTFQQVNGTLQWNQINAVPTLPTTDGKYKLVCNVVSGVPTMSWELEPDSMSYTEDASAPTLISFTVETTMSSTTYQAEEGMTWTEWCDSEYNTNGFSIEYDLIYLNDALNRVIVNQTSTDIIEDGVTYTTINTGGSD